MPRRPRVHLPHGFYHVTLRGNHQQDLFVLDGDRSVLNGIVARAVEKHGIRVHAYCWMTNHLHLLVQAGPDPLAEPMRQIAANFSRAMQYRMGKTGHFFERRYHAVLVEADSHLLELIRYIHLNPVRSGLVNSPGLYCWSSHHAYVGARVEAWVTTAFLLGMFSDDKSRAIAAYCDFLACAPPETDQAGAGDDKRTISYLGQTGGEARVNGNLAGLIEEACRRFGVSQGNLDSPVRDRYMTKVRAWIAHQARVRHIATLAAVARKLGRDEATLRQAIRTYPGEIE